MVAGEAEGARAASSEESAGSSGGGDYGVLPTRVAVRRPVLLYRHCAAPFPLHSNDRKRTRS